MKITREVYKYLKNELKTDNPNHIAKDLKVSTTTVYRVQKSKSYKNYKELCAIDAHRGLKPYNVTTVDDVIYDSGKRKNWFQRLIS